MTEQEKGKIVDRRNALIKLNEGLAIGRYKTIYQVKDEHNTCIMRDCQAEVFNVFGIKQDDASLFVMDVLKQIQSNVEILLSKKTYADPPTQHWCDSTTLAGIKIKLLDY